MLLLHGLANSASVWDAFLAHRGHGDGPEVWAADLPWRGDCVAHWSSRGDVVPYVADALRGVPGGAGVVVGHSMGANSLLEFLHRQLECGADPFTEYGIRALVLVSPFYRRAAEDFGWQSVETAVQNFVRTMTEGCGCTPPAGSRTTWSRSSAAGSATGSAPTAGSGSSRPTWPPRGCAPNASPCPAS
ncbi:alpha/beta fold hydrolase [Kitasatospora aburaviensis]